MSVKFDFDARTITLREALTEAVATGQLAPRDLELAFESEVVVRVKADGRTLNRLEKGGGAVAAAIKAYKMR